MNKKILLLVCFLMAFSTQAQLKKFSLEDAVLQQNRKFGADKLTGFQWIPNSSNYSYYTDSWTKMMSANVTKKDAVELVKLNDINTALGTKLKSFFGVQWIDSTAILISETGKYYSYNINTKSGKLIQEVPETAENQTFDDTKINVAFTEANNLYFFNKNKEKIAVTNNLDKNIVSGQTISRNEFGINGGIFWSPQSTYLAFYQKDETDVADYPLIDINETPGKLVNIKYPMIGQKSEKPSVGIYNLATQKTVFILPRGNTEDYVTNLAFSPDEKYILIAELNRGQNDMNLNLYDASTGLFIKTLFNEKNPKWVEPEHPAFFPNSKSNNFVWISEKDGFNNLYYYTIDGKLIKQLTINKFQTREIIGANPAGNEIYFKATGEKGINMLVYKVDLKGKQTLITRDEGIHNVVVSTDGNWIFDEYSNHSTPSKSLLYDKMGKAINLLESKNKFEG